MNVTVESIQLTPGSTIATGYGRDERGRLVLFGGDWRPMEALQEALRHGEEPTAYIEPWQILSAPHDR